MEIRVPLYSICVYLGTSAVNIILYKFRRKLFMKFNPDEIKEATKKDFDAAWNEGKKYVPNPGINEK